MIKVNITINLAAYKFKLMEESSQNMQVNYSKNINLY